ncbi:MAG: hypothetical protein K1X78_20315 [Verrucomicrobiaceae bacterium]|nr:hypothetical protein [Verrucomicrobiaceae bacterium]
MNASPLTKRIVVVLLSFVASQGFCLADGVIMTNRTNTTPEYWTAVPYKSLEKFALSIVVHSPTGEKITVPNPEFGDQIEFPDLAKDTFVAADDVAALKAKREKLAAAAARYKKASGLINPVVAAIDTALENLELGRVLVGGTWMNRNEYDQKMREATSKGGVVSSVPFRSVVLKNVRVSSVRGDRISVLHDGGIATILLSEISADVLSKLKATAPQLFIEKAPDAQSQQRPTVPPPAEKSATDNSEPLRKAKADLAQTESKIGMEREKWTEATNTINRLTNYKRTPVKEGSSSYYKCMEASKKIAEVEQGAEKLKGEKSRLEGLIKTLESTPSTVTEARSATASAPIPSSEIIAELRVPSGGIKGDDVYRQVHILTVEPDGLKISHEAGTSKIGYEKLPVELRARYKFDPAAAAEYRTKMEAQQKEISKRIADERVAEVMKQAQVAESKEMSSSGKKGKASSPAFEEAATRLHAVKADWVSPSFTFEKDHFYKLGPNMVQAIGRNIAATFDAENTAYVIGPPDGESFPPIRTMSVADSPIAVSTEGKVITFSAIGRYVKELSVRRTTVPMFACVYLEIDGKEIYNILPK